MAPSAVRTVCSFFAALQLSRVSAGTNEIGREFLKANKDREGVITTESGLQYKVLRKGAGFSHPLADSMCDCHYLGTTASLTPDAIDKLDEEWNEFDSSYKRGATAEFTPNMVIKGWTEAMQLMTEGDKWELYVPSELGYGDEGKGEKIKGGDALIFRMELWKIKGGKIRKLKCKFATKENCEPEETHLLDTYGGNSKEEISAVLEELREAKDDSDASSDDREAAKTKLMFMMRIMKAKNKNEL